MSTTTTFSPDTVASAIGDAIPSGSGISNAASRAADAVRQQADAALDQIRPKIDAVADYARNEPAKALLIAAATGAGLMALIALATRSNGGSSKPAAVASAVEKSDFASALRDLAARIPTAAVAATAASDAADASKARISSIAEAVADSVTDTLKNWRDQASPVVERIRPQLDAATAYAKEEPVKVALGVAVTGAILAGLVAALRSDD